ncbi:ScbR family autoregulator-binding transcription factor [Amycolatopsis cynarae]|uniref:ScbR family autoregulator-binding transcription factor n=1 Tax=Amycolatopsis cynarae TaxID=2995223 RepID=A0ABY7B7P5_9PSEU|nr:ScbR family autoregulator-binding transcription factor [Amycolatopsis sp. HUAS 11-8]WAL67970.1 ScbR family autoregulator-binding transcription factor [Amycolatopsis sp. HUAS 11-8]
MTKQARSEQTRRLLLDAAAQLLHRHGYAATSLVDISRAAGVTKGGLYFHFSSKDEICDEVQDGAVAMLREHVARELAAPLPALRRLANLGHTLMRWLDTEPRVGASFRVAREMGAKDERFVSFSRAWVAQVHEYVTEAGARGELRPGVRADRATLLVVAVCVGLESAVGGGTVAPETDFAGTLSDLCRFIDLSGPGGGTVGDGAAADRAAGK